MKTLDRYKKTNQEQLDSKGWSWCAGFACGVLFCLALSIFVEEMVRSAI